MKKAKLFLYLLAGLLVLSQVSLASAAPSFDGADSVSGNVQSITLETDPSTGVTTVLVTLMEDAAESRTVRLSQETAVELGLVLLDADGNPVINQDALGQDIEIQPKDEIPGEEGVQHPVGSALSVYFSDVPGLDYDSIMSAHGEGNGFGLIAQALWLTRKLEGDVEMLLAILEAKETGDFSAFTLPDGSLPANWGQFRKAVLDSDKKGGLGVVMSGKEKEKEKDNGNPNNPGNHGNGNHGNGGGDHNNNGNNQDKDKPKDDKGNQNRP